MTTDNKLNMITPFGPAIGSTNIPKTLIDKIIKICKYILLKKKVKF